jgi:two-component system cell cycle sensor histidine kinase/response regulator CckA
MVSEFYHAVIRITDEVDVLKRVCRVLSEQGGYPIAWAGLVEADNAVRLVAQEGLSETVLEVPYQISDAAKDDPIASAILTCKYSRTGDSQSGFVSGPWRGLPLQHKSFVSIALPILCEQKAIGVVALYAVEPDAFNQTETDLLTEMAGNLSYAIISLRAQAHRRQAEEELFDSRQMLLSVLDTIPQRVFWKDRNMVYVGCNKPLALDCGYSNPSELVGKTDYETASAETADAYRADDVQVMESGIPKLNYEESQRKPDGSKAWLMTSKVPLRDKDGRVIGVLGTYEDITAYKRLEEQFRQAQKMEAFGQLSGGIAHDFNNLLTVIHGNASMLQNFQLSGSEIAAAIKHIAHAVEQGANLTRQLLTFSRRQPFQPKKCNLNDIVANTTTMLQRLIGEHISLEFVASQKSEPVNADAGMMEQVLINQAINSRDAMSQGGRLTVQTATILLDEAQAAAKPGARPGAYVRLSVSDTGCGIAPEHLPHVFEPFFTTKDVGKGTGLGLATVFGIIEKHHGWIEVKSQVGMGTVFHLFLPRESNLSGSVAEPAHSEQSNGGAETILLVEDESAVLHMMRLLLSHNGYHVLEANSGTVALQIWRQRKSSIDLLLTDMVMPEGISGRDLEEKLRVEKPDLKVIFCSGYAAEFFNNNAPLRDKDHFLRKPFDPQELLTMVRSVLDGV